MAIVTMRSVSRLESVYMRLLFGRNEIFSFRRLVSYNCLHEIAQSETHRGRYFILVILIEMKFYFG